MTVPRELALKHVDDQVFLASQPIKELAGIALPKSDLTDIRDTHGKIQTPCRIDVALDSSKDFLLTLENDAGEKVLIGYDKNKNQYFIDRSQSGKVDFYNGFGGRHIAPRLSYADQINFSLIADASSVELFADDGLTVMTDIVFPSKPYDQMKIEAAGQTFKKFRYFSYKSIWHN